MAWPMTMNSVIRNNCLFSLRFDTKQVPGDQRQQTNEPQTGWERDDNGDDVDVDVDEDDDETADSLDDEDDDDSDNLCSFFHLF